MIRWCNPLFLFTFLLLLGCSEKETELDFDNPTLASIDGRPITQTSFQRGYLPLLLYGDKFDSPENRLGMINHLIGQKLLGDKGREAKLDTIGIVQRMRKNAESKALARQLYNKWVREKMEMPTEEELREGFYRGQKGVFVRHLFAKTEAEIREYARRLSSGNESFYTLAQDVFTDSSLSRSGGALGWITFGDLDETLEDTVYNLKPGRISQPVKSQYGWHIVSVDDTQEQLFLSETDYQQNRTLIHNKIVERRENLLGKQVLNDFMSNFEIEFNRDITKQVWPLVIEHLNPEGKKRGQSLEIAGLFNSMDALRDETLLTVDGEKWTVMEIVKRLPDLERSLLYGNLYVAASNIIRNEMISREAKRLGLQEHPMVVEEMQDHEDRILGDTYVSRVADTLVFTSTHQEQYFESHKLQKYHAPDSLSVELFTYADSAGAVRALYQLRNDNIYTGPGDETFWLTDSDEDIPLYKLMRSIASGTSAGPVEHEGKWTIGKLIERRRTALSFDAIKDRVLADMEQERFSATRNLLVEELKPGHDISIDLELLNK